MMLLTSLQAQATTYYWVGGANGDWTTAANWNTSADGSGTTGIPASADNVYIQSSAIISIGSNNISVDGISLGSNGQSTSFAVKLTGTTGTLTVGNHTFSENSADTGIVTYRPTATTDTSITSSLELDCNVSASNLAIHSGGNVTISSGKNATIPTVNIMAGSNATPTNLSVDGKLTSSTSITAANYSNQTITVGSTGVIEAGTITGYTGTVTNNGLIVTQTAVDSSLVGSGNAPVTPSAGEIVWTGVASNAWATAGNWAGGSVPSSTDKIKIPASAPNKPVITTAITIDDTANLTIDTGTNITVNASGNLTLTTGTFDISKINNNSTGTLIFSGNYSHSSDDYSAPNLVIECGGNLTVSKNLECKSIIVTGTSTLNNSSGITYLVARGNDGINFGNTVTVNASGSQFILGGNVTSTGTVNVEIASGMLNHVEETTSHNKTWGTNLTADLKANGTTFGMAQGSTYQTKVEAGSGDVYFVGNGTISSLNDSGAGCNIHFGNADSTQNNTLTFSSNIAFSTSGKIIFDESCSGLSGSVTLSGINKIENKSTKLTNTLGVNFSLNSGAEITGASATENAIKFNDLTFAGTATVGVNIENSGTLSAATGAITFNKDYTNKGTASFGFASSIAGNFVNSGSAAFTGGLTLAKDFTDSGTAFSGNITLNGNSAQTFKGSTASPGYNVILNNSNGNVEFTDALTLHSLDTTTNNYIGNITFNGTGNQTLTPQTGAYAQITVNKSSDTLTLDGNSQINTFTLTAGDVTFNGDSQINTFTHTAGNVTFNGNVTFTDAVALNSVTGKTITFSGGTDTSPHTISGTTLSLTNLTGAYVSVSASASLAINGANISGLSIASTIPEIKMQGTVNITGTNDFVIDYPLLLSGNTTLNAAENIKIQNSTGTPAKIGSINSATDTARTLSLKTTGTGKSIQIQNGASEGAGLGTTKALSTITINSSLDLTENTTFKTSGTNGTTLAGTGSLSGSGTLTSTGNLRNNGTWTINRPVIVDGNFSNLSGKSLTVNENIAVSKNVTDSGSWTTISGKKITFNGTTAQSFTVNTSNTYRDVVVDKTYGTFAITGKLTADNFTAEKAITLAGDIEIETSNDVIFKQTVTNTANLSIKADELQFQAAANVNNITIEATTTTSSDITVTGNWTNNKTTGGFTANGGTVKFTPTETTASISGNNTFNNLTAGDETTGLGGKAITFAAGSTQIVAGLLKLNGSSASKLTLRSSTPGSEWNIVCQGSDPNIINYVDLQDSKNQSTYDLYALSSTDSGKNTKWNFPGMDYTWEGNSDSSWNTAANWNPASVPGKGAIVTIDPVTSTASTLLLTATLNLNDTFNGHSYNGTIIVNPGAVFDIAGESITAASVTNKGTIRITGVSSSQAINATMNNVAGSTVEYYGTSTTTNFVWDGEGTTSTAGKQYANLIISSPTTAAADLTISENLTVNNVTTLTTGTITATGASSLSKINANLSATELSLKATEINCAQITTTGNQTYNGAVTVKYTTATPVLSAQLTSLIKFAGTVGGYAHTESLTISTAKAEFDGTVSNLAALTTDEAVINCASIQTSGNQTYNGAVTVKYTTAAPTLSSTSATSLIKFVSTVSGNAGSENLTISTAKAEFDDTVSNLASLQTAAAIINCDSIQTSVNQTYNGAVTVKSASPTLSAANTSLIKFVSTLSGDAGSEALTISTAKAEFDNNVSNLAALTTASADINCASIQTSGNQLYNGAVSIIKEGGSTLSITNTGTGTITFSNTSSVNGSKKLTLVAGSNNINFNGTVGSSETYLSDLQITSSGTTIFANPVYITKLTDTASSGNLTFTKGGIITGVNGNTLNTSGTNGTFTVGASTDTESTAPTLTLSNNLTHTAGNTVIYGSLNAPAKNITLGVTSGNYIHLIADNTILTQNLSSSSNVSVTGNLIISGTASGVELSAPVTVTENIVMHSGAITANQDLTATKDILILGSAYSEQDSTTNIADEYSYTITRPDGWSSKNYEAALPATKTATLSVAADKIISAGINFYANGTSLSLKSGDSGQWKLKLPDLTTPLNGFAEAYFTKITDCKVICGSSEDGSMASLITLDDTDSAAEKLTNTNVDFDEFKITSAYTVRDNAIRIEFNRPVRYHAGTISRLAFDDAGSGKTFSGFYSEADCTPASAISTTEAFPSYTSTVDGNTYYYCYIKADAQNSATTGAWNTDATGKSTGATDGKSSDRDGIHHDTKPCLDFPRALQGSGSTATIPFILTDIWGKRLNNYSQRVTKASAAEPAYGSENSAHDVEDKTGPVLWSVRTGQELHDAYDVATGEASQHSYDSHNFLEFRYSEPVDFYSGSSVTPLNITENIQVTDAFGAIAENITTQGTLTFAGLAKISDSKLYTGSQGSPNKYVNALYRPEIGSPAAPDAYAVRLSIAGWTNGTVADAAGNDYKKWPGYIEAATQFTGKTATAVAVTNNCVRDRSSAKNPQTEYAVGSRTEPVVTSTSSGTHTATLLPTSPDLYSAWDLSAPVFAPLRFSAETDWGNQDMSEAIGNTNGSGSTLDRIDFHFFDNTPTYTSSDEAEWFTEIGWCLPGSQSSKSNLKDSSYTYCADIIGGARQFDTTPERRTTGGIRFSTKADISDAFKYSPSQNDPSPAASFLDGVDKIHTTVVSQLFTGSSAPMRPANDPDGLYLGLTLSDTSLSVETTFAFAYNEGQGYLTDLAGNRLRSRVSKTIDRTPPSFDIILSPVEKNSMYIIFVKELVTESGSIKFISNSGAQIPITESFETLIPKCFRLITIDENGIVTESTENQIDESVPAQIIEDKSNESFTCLKLTLKQNVTLEDIKKLYIQLIIPSAYPDQTTDPLTNNINSHVTFIQDHLGNYMSLYSAHALSDFAINYVNPLYAYSSDITTAEGPVMNGLYEEGSWAVHDWNEDQKNYGTLPAAHSTAIVAATPDGANQKVRIYLSANPDAESIAVQYNKDFGTSHRIWLPEIENGVFRALAGRNNTNFVASDSSALGNNSSNLIFNLSKEVITSFGSGSQVSFMFGLMNDEDAPLMIYSNPYYDVSAGRFNFTQSRQVPLFTLRMTDTNNLNTLDLWSFRLKSITDQRGSVTILNNVINASKGEKTVVKVDVAEAGKVNVIVMTLDGNIITYLNRGKLDAGENYFTWNGKNKSGDLVARGMYFIRVSGNGFDETRKVMVVK